MTGVYYQTDHNAGEFIHFVFWAEIPEGAAIEPEQNEVAEFGFFAVNALPDRMSPSVRLRFLDALARESQALPITLPPKAEQWEK